MILKFFDIFLKMKDLSSSEAFMVTIFVHSINQSINQSFIAQIV